ncbi:hypothetical protein FGG08_007510 [Glutinoglossum americanum]|uniref:Uncharacterized protein n=1 Tax=Glutinoglossum americanum TaxID=1670608 RepID=A0A9P8HW48_9PEZI|nr:hypothetical protein FGG08_007510 [Glutinoglossum americanum]
MSQSSSSLPLIIPYDGPGDDSDDEEITTLIPLSDPLLRSISWDELRTLNSQSIVFGSPWGQYYKLEYETGSAWEKSYRISQAAKSLEDAAEKIREARNARGVFGAGGLAFSGIEPQGTSVFGPPTQGPQTQLQQPSSTFGSSNALSGLFGASAQPLPSLGRSSLFGASATGSRSFGGSSFSTSPDATKSSGPVAIEQYALMETPSYPPTANGELLLQDWFLGGADNLENAFITSPDKPETLQNLLLSISQPGFSVLLSVKLMGHRPDVLHVNCACAYAIKILHRQGAEYFNFVLENAPAGVLLDVALFARGALIGPTMEHRVLQAAAIALTTPEPKDAKEVTYARGVAVMVSRMISRFHKENTLLKDEAERAALLETRMRSLIETVSESPIALPPNPRAAVTASAALCALILSGALTFADELQQRREKNQQRAELAVSATLSCIGFAAPVPYLAAAGGLATILGTAIVRHIWRPRDPGLKAALVIQTLQTVLWPLVRRREVLPVGLVGLSFEEVGEFKMFFELVVQSAWVGYWQRG